jgi:hypothetical protein
MDLDSKSVVTHEQHVQTLPNANPISNMDPAERAALEKRLVRKLDTRLMPVLFVMIILKYDFSKVSNHR